MYLFKVSFNWENLFVEVFFLKENIYTTENVTSSK